MRQLHITVAVLALAFASSGAFAKPPSTNNLYKWVDEDGKVHYSDRVPPEASGLGHEKKSQRGVTVGTVEAAKTPQQLEAERAAQEAERKRKEAEAKQAEQDRILLMTFSSAAEIERARDDRIAAVEARIKLTEERLRKLEPQLEQARKQAADQERSGKASPDSLHQRITQLQKQIADYQKFIAEREQERAAIKTKFDADLARFKELKGR